MNPSRFRNCDKRGATVIPIWRNHKNSASNISRPAKHVYSNQPLIIEPSKRPKKINECGRCRWSVGLNCERCIVQGIFEHFKPQAIACTQKIDSKIHADSTPAD